MPLWVIRNDITAMKVDAIVNAANSTLLGGGGVDGAIHHAAGPGLLEECRTLGGCVTGEAKITAGYRLPARHVIHTVGPVYKGGGQGEEALLASCYKNSLLLAKDSGCSSVAFPLISAGVYGYPKEEAMRVADETIRAFLDEYDMDVYLVLFDGEAAAISRRLFRDVREYVDNRYVDAVEKKFGRSRFGLARRDSAANVLCEEPQTICGNYAPAAPFEATILADAADSLETAFDRMDESFSEMLFRLIDEKGMTDVECYKKACVDRKVFSKIRSTASYRPSKTTAVSFALALELPLNRAKRLIELAGYSLTHNNKFDIIIEYFIEHGKFDILEINEVLFEFDQKLLGC